MRDGRNGQVFCSFWPLWIFNGPLNWTEMNYEDQRHFFHFQIKWNTVYNSDFISIIILVLTMIITMTININNAKNEVFSYSTYLVFVITMCWHKGETIKVQKPEDLHTMSILRSKALCSWIAPTKTIPLKLILWLLHGYLYLFS